MGGERSAGALGKQHAAGLVTSSIAAAGQLAVRGMRCTHCASCKILCCGLRPNMIPHHSSPTSEQ